MRLHRISSTFSAVVVMIGTLLTPGCAHAPKPTVAASTPSSASHDTAGGKGASSLPVHLPYVYTRRGVEVRVNYVEFVQEQLQVNVQLQENRNEAVEILVSTLIQVRAPGGPTLPYAGYIRDGAVLNVPEIRLSAGERESVAICFTAPLEGRAEDSQVELLFPTGKSWKSASR